MSGPTAAHIIATLVLNPENPKKGQINRWLERYLKGATSEILSSFSASAQQLISYCKVTELQWTQKLCPRQGFATNRTLLFAD